MKTHKHLWERFITEENFSIAYKNSIKGKGKQKQVQIFQENAEENLEHVRQMCINGQFHTSPYRSKKIYEPKERDIYILPYNPDRIVQHAIMNVLKPIFVNRFIENSYACIDGKGTHRASAKCTELTRRYKYCLKCDIKQFYPSINQAILSQMLHRIIKDDLFMEIVDDVVFSFPNGHNCPIGNYCSQWFGNFYLTALDNFVLHELKDVEYIRYCDDFLLFSNDKQHLRYCDKEIEKFLVTLDLEYSKHALFKTKQGVDFCGYRSFGKYVLLRKTTAHRMKRRIKDIKEHINSGNYNVERIRGQIASAHGQLSHCCSYHLRQALEIDTLTAYMKGVAA